MLIGKSSLLLTSVLCVIRGRNAERVLDKKHIDYLLADGTHEIWAGLTIKEKCRFFHVRYPDKVIAPITLSRFFKEHRIRKKRVRITKATPPAEKHKVDEQKIEALAKMSDARNMELEIVYLDEIVFTKSSIHRKAWSNVG